MVTPCLADMWCSMRTTTPDVVAFEPRKVWYINRIAALMYGGMNSINVVPVVQGTYGSVNERNTTHKHKQHFIDKSRSWAQVSLGYSGRVTGNIQTRYRDKTTYSCGWVEFANRQCRATYGHRNISNTHTGTLARTLIPLLSTDRPAQCARTRFPVKNVQAELVSDVEFALGELRVASARGGGAAH